MALWLEEALIDEAEAARFDPAVAWASVRQFAASLQRAPLREQVAVGQSMPDWLAARLLADWGDEAISLAQALSSRAPMTIRSNLLRAPKATLIELLAEQGLEVAAGRYSDTALQLSSRINLFGIEAFKEGYFEAQDEGSQLLADLTYVAAGPKPKLIVDYCAGAGGKTLALAARMSNKGRLVSTDIDDRKLQQLKKRARRARVSNHQAIAISADAWPDELHRLVGTADGVLVDAPCSGTGALRRNPEAKWRMQERDIAEFVAKQRQIARKAAALVRPGGVLVYATCSVLAAENAEQARALAGELPGFAAEPVTGVDAALIDAHGHFVTAPHRTGTDGFFAAVFRRRA
ncbi:MAG: RsmB/NOP family class I SAM-dependent RNA methyltransferase [Myxococcales bacterium]|nr:RsmB/NOP family class I SAM-dependent RNA methyltransferase [Myxococcales bacterium]